jgi:pimeloyl-ACP methyl ester carboxylesterase
MMATYVLVHGAWHGGWCWRRTTDLLRAKGHRVFEPTLSGVGSRVHEATPSIGVYPHAADVAGLVEMEEIEDIILVGHSYGGMVITAAAEKIADRVRTIVYLDAFVPKDGESLMTHLPPDRALGMVKGAMNEGEGWRVPAPHPNYFGVKSQDDIDWIVRRCTPQPLLTFMQPLRSTAAAQGIAKKVYIRAAGHPGPTFAPFGEMAKASAGWDYHEVACGHEIMIEMPQELARILMNLA